MAKDRDVQVVLIMHVFMCCHMQQYKLLQARLSSVTPVQILLKTNRVGQVYPKMSFKKEINGGKKFK